MQSKPKARIPPRRSKSEEYGPRFPLCSSAKLNQFGRRPMSQIEMDVINSGGVFPESPKKKQIKKKPGTVANKKK